MTTEHRRLTIPESIADDSTALELLTGWSNGKKMWLMTRTGTPLDRAPHVWGEILASFAQNIAKSLNDTTGADQVATLAAIKKRLDGAWEESKTMTSTHYQFDEFTREK